MLKIAESLNIKLRLQSDSLVSILKPNANPKNKKTHSVFIGLCVCVKPKLAS